MNATELRKYNKDRQIVQVGYASADVRSTIKTMHDVLGIGPWTIVTLTDQNSRHVKVNGKRADEPFFVYVAHANVGKMDFEVLQPVYGPNAYSQFIEERGAGLQHPKEKFAKEDLWDATLDAEEAGAKLLLTGGIDVDRFVYVDMQEMGAGIYELGNQPDLELENEKWPVGDVEELLAANRTRAITQIGYVAYDLKRVMRALTRALKMGPWTIAELNNANTSDFRINGMKAEEPFSCKVAVCMAGDIQFEIIQPVLGLDPLFDYLRRHGEGPHHVKERLSNEQRANFVRRMAEKGFQPQLSGTIGGESFVSYGLEDLGISVYEAGGPTGYLSLKDYDTEIWPAENQ